MINFPANRLQQLRLCEVTVVNQLVYLTLRGHVFPTSVHLGRGVCVCEVTWGGRKRAQCVLRVATVWRGDADKCIVLREWQWWATIKSGAIKTEKGRGGRGTDREQQPWRCVNVVCAAQSDASLLNWIWVFCLFCVFLDCDTCRLLANSNSMQSTSLSSLCAARVFAHAFAYTHAPCSHLHASLHALAHMFERVHAHCSQRIQPVFHVPLSCCTFSPVRSHHCTIYCAHSHFFPHWNSAQWSV